MKNLALFLIVAVLLLGTVAQAQAAAVSVAAGPYWSSGSLGTGYTVNAKYRYGRCLVGEFAYVVASCVPPEGFPRQYRMRNGGEGKGLGNR